MSSKTIIISVFLFFQIAFSQSLFLDRGKSGAGAFIGYSGTTNASSLSGSLGYSLSGMVDLQYGYGRTTYTRQDITGDVQAFVLGFQLVKQDTNKKAVSFGVNLGYSSMKINFKSYSYAVSSNDNLTLGVTLSRKSMFKNHLGILGSVNYAYSFASSSGISSYGMQVAILGEFSRKFLVVAGPSIQFAEETQTFGFSAGVIYIPNGE